MNEEDIKLEKDKEARVIKKVHILPFCKKGC